MRLKKATSLKSWRRRGEAVGEFGARGPRRRPARPVPRSKPRPQRKPQVRGQRREQRAERVQERLWSEAVALGENLQIQAAQGYRGAVLELRPGLFLVAELRDEGFAGGFGAKVQPKDVTDEIVRVTDRALDAILPGRKAQKQSQADESRRRAELARREQELAARQRLIEQQQAQRALPAPTPTRALPAPQRLPAGSARWLDDDADEVGHCRVPEETWR